MSLEKIKDNKAVKTLKNGVNIRINKPKFNIAMGKQSLKFKNKYKCRGAPCGLPNGGKGPAPSLRIRKDKINPKIIRTKEQYEPHLRTEPTQRYKKSSFLILKNQEVKSNSIEKHL
jgi:hypothetical protein